MGCACHIVGAEWVLKPSLCKQTWKLHFIRVWGQHKSAYFFFLLYHLETQSSLRAQLQAPASIYTCAPLFRLLLFFFLHRAILHIFTFYDHLKYTFETDRFKSIMVLLSEPVWWAASYYLGLAPGLDVSMEHWLVPWPSTISLKTSLGCKCNGRRNGGWSSIETANHLVVDPTVWW